MEYLPHPEWFCWEMFVSEVAHLQCYADTSNMDLLQCYADTSNMEMVALKACTAMQVLLLQKPNPRSKAKDHSLCLRRCLELWKNGLIEELFKECKCLRTRLLRSHPKIDIEQTSWIFSKLMMLGKTKLLCNSSSKKLMKEFSIRKNILKKSPAPCVRSLRNYIQMERNQTPNTAEQQLPALTPVEPIIVNAIEGTLIKTVAS